METHVWPPGAAFMQRTEVWCARDGSPPGAEAVPECERHPWWRRPCRSPQQGGPFALQKQTA